VTGLVPEYSVQEAHMSTQAPTDGFSKEYVEQLRQENADWRRKYQDEKSRNTIQAVGSELTLRGIKAEASWVDIKASQTPSEAVDAFLAKFPHLAPQAAAGPTQDVTRQVGADPAQGAPKPMGPGTGAGAATPVAGPPLESVRRMNEIKADPQARAQISSHYREMLRQQGQPIPD
jgi:hypothetical protein